MRNFATSGILGASLALLQGCWAQLPQECFLHSKAHGGIKVGSYMSDLPLLEFRYDPQWDLESVKGYLSESGALNGIQITHINPRNTKVPLNIIGAEDGRQHKSSFSSSDATAISIMYTEDFVCNVAFTTSDNRVEMLSESLEDSCNALDDGVDTTVLKLDKDYPLVGFHGRERDNHLVDLGVIWLDSRNENCQKKLNVLEQNIAYGNSETIPSAKDAYKNLTDEERHRGTELEALLTFHNLIQSESKQDEIKQKIYDNVLDLEYEQSRLIADLANSDLANNAELYQQVEMMQMELDKFVKSVTRDEVSQEEIDAALKNFHEYNQVIEQMLNPNRIFEGTAEPIGFNSHEKYAMQVAMRVVDIESEQKKLQAQIEMYERDGDEYGDEVDALIKEADNHMGVLTYLLNDDKIKSQGALLNGDIDKTIKDLLDTYYEVTQLMADVNDEFIKERYQENLVQTEHEIEYLLELKQLTKSKSQSQHIVMTFSQVQDYIEFVKEDKEDIRKDIDDTVNDRAREHYNQQIALKDKEIEALEELMKIARHDDREIVSREDIDQFIVMMQDVQSLLVQQIGEEDTSSAKNVYLLMFKDRQHQLNFALDLEAEFANQIDWSTGSFNETPTGQKVTEIKDLVLELQEERVDEELNKEWLQYNSMDLQESLEGLVTDEEYMELELQNAQDLLQQTLDEQFAIMQKEQAYLNMKPEKMTDGGAQGVTREYFEKIEKVFAILTFFLFLSSMTCGGCVTFAVVAKCCKSSGNKEEVNMQGQRREANTLEMQVVQTESPGVSPASRGSRRLPHTRQESGVTFNLNLKKTGSLESVE